jgi:UDP-glucose 4-epimerase
VQNVSARQGRATEGQRGNRPLVIGCGFIGSRIVAALSERGEHPRVLTRSRPNPSTARLIDADQLRLGDAADPAVLAGSLDGIDRVVFAAGGLLPAASELEPERDAELTLGPVRAVLDALRERPEASFTYLSSGGTVYGEPERVPVPETAPTRPLGVYGELHLRCEEEIMAASERDSLRVRILRCATVYGEGQLPERGQGAVVTFLHRADTGVPIDLFGGGATIRDYIYVDDVARVVVELAGRGGEGPPILNVGSGTGTSLAELLALVEAEIGHPAAVVHNPPRDFEVHQIVLDVSGLQRLVNLAPTPITEGIARTHRWLRARAPESA